MIKEFLDWAQQLQNGASHALHPSTPRQTHVFHLAVWIVSTEQLLAWVQNPQPISQLDQVDALKCSTPQVSQQICNGMPQSEAGLLEHCPFSDFPWSTCVSHTRPLSATLWHGVAHRSLICWWFVQYGCPTEQVSPSNPNPPQQTVAGQQSRFRLPANCSTPFWDPIKGQCTCTDASCQFTDDTRAIGVSVHAHQWA
jgi:hypothetical protein